MRLIQALNRAAQTRPYRAHFAVHSPRESLLQLVELLRLLRKSHARVNELQPQQRAVETCLHRTQLSTNAGTHTFRRPRERLQTGVTVRRDELRGTRWCRRTSVGNEVRNRKVDLMSDSRYNRN